MPTCSLKLDGRVYMDMSTLLQAVAKNAENMFRKFPKNRTLNAVVTAEIKLK